MAKRDEQIDWYVEMSERMERRERRRKWVWLGVAVAVPLSLMAAFVALVLLQRHGVLDWLKGQVRPTVSERPAEPKETPLGPVSVEAFQKGDIRFPQLDDADLMTSINHFFRELRPEKAEVFTVNRENEDKGTILAYRLMNIGTTDTYEFTDVEVKRMGGEWTISEEGWAKIRTELQARMKVKLGRPTL